MPGGCRLGLAVYRCSLRAPCLFGDLFRIPGELFCDERLSGILPPISGISLCNEMLLSNCKWPSLYKVIVMVS